MRTLIVALFLLVSFSTQAQVPKGSCRLCLSYSLPVSHLHHKISTILTEKGYSVEMVEAYDLLKAESCIKNNEYWIDVRGERNITIWPGFTGYQFLGFEQYHHGRFSRKWLMDRVNETIVCFRGMYQ